MESDLIDLALQVPIKLDHNTSADFIKIVSKKKEAADKVSAMSKSEGCIEDELLDVLNDLQGVGDERADYSELENGNCCIEGGDSLNQSFNYEIEELINEDGQKQRNLDNAIDEALGNN